MDDDDEYLGYLDPYFLEDLGFKERRQFTTDTVRLSEWSIAVPSDDNETRHEIGVLYELSISDSPDVSWTDNLSWYFEGVTLNTVSVEGRKRYERLRSVMDGTYEDSHAFLNNGTITRTELPIETKQELVDFVNKLNRNEK